jgi:hypothetical protein
MPHIWKTTALTAVILAAGWISGQAQGQQMYGTGGMEGCASCCPQPCLPQPGRFCCPPPFCHTQEGPPCIKYKCGCPRPVCNPCDLPHYGYFQPCWRPNPFAPDFSHCPSVPPAALVTPTPLQPSTPPVGEPEAPIPPSPKKTPETLPQPIPGKLSLDPPMKY